MDPYGEISLFEEIEVKSVLNKVKHHDDLFLTDYTVNPFIGCSYNCIYCYIHGSKYGGENTTNLRVKVNAHDVLSRQLKNRARKREYGVIGVGTATEPYLSLEGTLGLTLELLRIIYRFKFPVNVITKSKLVLRDLELLRKMDGNAILPPRHKGKLDHGTILTFSFSTVDHNLSRIFEPGASTVEERLETMQKFAEEGFLVGASLMPILPFLSDSREQLDELIGKVKEHGGEFVLVMGLTLYGDKPTDCKVRYYDTLEMYFPEAVPKTRRLFGDRSAPSHSYQRKLAELTEELASKHDIRTRILK